MKYIFITLLLPLAAFSVRAEDDGDTYATAAQAGVSAQAQSTDGLNLSDSAKDSFYYGWNYPANYSYGFPYYRNYYPYHSCGFCPHYRYHDCPMMKMIKKAKE